MRIISISSSIASAVAACVAVCVAFAGIAVRTFLHLTTMREPMGYWQEPCQSEFSRRSDLNSQSALRELKPSNHAWLLPHGGIATLAVCPAPTRLAAVRDSRRG
jgi:hypothetical protein